MVQPWSFMNFVNVVKPFGSILEKVSFGYVMLGVVIVQPWSIMKFGLVDKPFDSTLKNVVLGYVSLGYVRSSNGTALVDLEICNRS